MRGATEGERGQVEVEQPELREPDERYRSSNDVPALTLLARLWSGPMPTFFPRNSVDWQLEEPRHSGASRCRCRDGAGDRGRAAAAARVCVHPRPGELVLSYGAVFARGLILLGMTTAHLANFPLRRWAWRAPLFAFVETAGEMATSLLLIALGREPEGTARADFHDWPSMALARCCRASSRSASGAAARRRSSCSCGGAGWREGVDAEPVVDPEIPA